MELRKDYVLDRWVIIASNRSHRPHEHKEKKKKSIDKSCVFCPGNENKTPPEIYRIPKGKSWKVRVFKNKFPAVDQKGKYKIQTHNKYFTFSDAYGIHEVIVETPDHSKKFAELSVKEIRDILNIYKLRINELSKKRGIKYVAVFKNSGAASGESIGHSHSQIIAYNKIPNSIKEELKVSKKNCPYCEIIPTEKRSYRRCFENDSFVAFTPYASRFPYEIWIFSKDHLKDMNDMDESKLMSLAEIIKKITLKLKEIGASYGFMLHYSPKGKDLHFHVEVYPRVSIKAGFELGTQDDINIVSPEDAAKFYRGE